MLLKNNIHKTFWAAVLITFVIKSLLASVIPITSDEAYFVLWAQNLDFGYYDHPPMIGWVLRAFMLLGTSEFFLRLPSLLTSCIVGVLIYTLLKREDAYKAAIVGTLFTISPFNILFFLISNDTPLVFFSFLSSFYLFKALDSDRYSLYLASGVCLGLSFLSKYFAVLMGLAYLLYWIFTEKRHKKTIGFFVLFLAAIPFLYSNLYWNYTHSWANFMFNVINRNKSEAFEVSKILVFFIIYIYMVTPVAIYYLTANRREAQQNKISSHFDIFFYSFFVPTIIFFLLSFNKTIGLHWILSFYPFVFFLFFFGMHDKQLIKTTKFMFWFSLLHLCLITVIMSLPVERYSNFKEYNLIVMGMEPEPLIKYLKEYENDYIFAAQHYSDAALMSYQYGKHFIVFGKGSLHARQDDILTDYNMLSGKNIMILSNSKPHLDSFAPYFNSVKVERFEANATNFYFIMGKGFKYEPYKKNILSIIKEKYYDIPGILPYKKCYFREKYFVN